MGVADPRFCGTRVCRKGGRGRAIAQRLRNQTECLAGAIQAAGHRLQEGARFEPANTERAAELRAGWARAVERSKGWAT